MRFQVTPMVKNLLIINIGIFILSVFYWNLISRLRRRQTKLERIPLPAFFDLLQQRAGGFCQECGTLGGAGV